MCQTSVAKVFSIGSLHGLPCREDLGHPGGDEHIHDEWKEGNARENQALFDCQGKVLPSVKVFN